VSASGASTSIPATSPGVGYLFGQETVAGVTPTGEVRRNRPFDKAEVGMRIAH